MEQAVLAGGGFGVIFLQVNFLKTRFIRNHLFLALLDLRWNMRD